MAARKKTTRSRRRPAAAKAKPQRRAKRAAAKPARPRKPTRKQGNPRRAAAKPRVRIPRAAPRAPVPPEPVAVPPQGSVGGGVPEQDAAATARFSASLAVLASRPERAAVVVHAYPRAGVALLAVESSLGIGDRIHVRGATSDFVAEVRSLRVGGVDVERAERGAATLALPERARTGDVVYALRAPA